MFRLGHLLKGKRYFAAVLYKVVDGRSSDSIISWSKSGKSFIVWDVEEFERVIIRKFGLTKFQFFAYRLKTFGFRKVESGQCEYANDDFVKGKPELTLEIAKKREESFKIKSIQAILSERSSSSSSMETTKGNEKAISKDLSNLNL